MGWYFSRRMPQTLFALLLIASAANSQDDVAIARLSAELNSSAKEIKTDVEKLSECTFRHPHDLSCSSPILLSAGKLDAVLGEVEAKLRGGSLPPEKTIRLISNIGSSLSIQ